ncbi:MAG: hypothetical protein Q7K11_00010 [Candidatus Berkelbacteria bacterium]|nr:hypothetical protein [Candidatus Berkelbacteria bacterium]
MTEFPKIKQKNKQRGYATIVVIALVVLASFILIWGGYSNKDQKTSDNQNKGTCKPEKNGQVIPFGGREYRLIKSGVSIPIRYLSDISDDTKDKDPHLDYAGLLEIKGETNYMYTPGTYRNPITNGYEFRSGGRIVKIKNFAEIGFIFSTRKGKTQWVNLKGSDYNDGRREVWGFDIYIDVTKPIPSEITNCDDFTDGTQIVPISPVPTLIWPSQTESPDKKQLQLKYFGVKYEERLQSQINWWSVECKPAIYLYPEKKMNVKVAVMPKGFLTYTDPKYPKGGWEVTAYPDGRITSGGKDYEYLYYESKILDSEINKPTEGFVVLFDELPNLYSSILPKLGLSEKETKDFKEYWEKALPKSPYYFVGIMKEKDIEKIEPLTISPKEATMIRVRLYFQALDKKIDIKEPVMTSYPRRDGFSVVEWGGIVKIDKEHEFSCSQ